MTEAELVAVVVLVSLAVFSVAALEALHEGRLPGVRFVRRASREVPLWQGGDVVAAIVFYVVSMVGVAVLVAVLFRPEEGQLSELAVLVASVLQNGAMCLFVVFLVTRVRGQSLSALGFVDAPVRNVAAVVLVFVLMFPPLQLVTLVWQAVLGGLGVDLERQQAVELFQEAVRTTDLAGAVYLAIAAVVIAPVAEEILFRGFVYGMFRTRWGPVAGAVLSSVIFALFHDMSLVIFVPIVVVGLFLCYVYERTGSLPYAMFFHFLFNGVQLLALVLQQ